MMLRKVNFVVVLCLVLLGATTANAQDQDHPECYTLASLQGSYAIIGHYGDHLAMALTEGQFDGKGNFQSTFIVNEPDPTSATGARKIVTGSQTGTYTINCDGTGVITRFVKLASGETGTVVSDLIITKALRSRPDDGKLIATAVEDAQRTPSFIVPGGVFLTRTYTRLPSREEDSD
jgi:predicted GNAT family acetyltransferase